MAGRPPPPPPPSIGDIIRDTPVATVVIDGVTIHCKCEFLLPGGSVKDRSALECIRSARRRGLLADGQTVVEMTSGNMGAGLAIACGAHGHPFVAFMSKGNSEQRRVQMERFGATVVMVDQVDGGPGMVTGADIALAARRAREHAAACGGYYVDQFNHDGCVAAHAEHTGAELVRDLGGRIRAFACCVGTAGTFTGVSRRLKAFDHAIACFAVEPAGCEVLAGRPVTMPAHLLQGSGYGIVPPKFDRTVCDGYLSVTDEACLAMRDRLARRHGLFVGFTAAANVVACLDLARTLGLDRGLATVLCDTGFKYG